jgi:tetratricopeptide (TPR) repeat protein
MRLRSLVVYVFLGMAAACGLAAPQQWIRVTSPHFIVITNSYEKQGRHILDQFERMRWVFQTMFPGLNVDPPEPIVIIVAADQKTFQAFEPAAYLAHGQLKLGGLFQRTADKNYILVNQDSENEQHPYAVIYHEYTHLQFRNDQAWIPIWLNEGLAVFFENTEINSKDVHLGIASVDRILYLRNNTMIPLDVLFRVDYKSPYYHEADKGNIFYAESWALTHFLQVTDRQNHTNRLQTYLQLCRNHEDPVVAGEKAFGDLKVLEDQLTSYTRRSQYMEFVLNSASAPIDESSFKVQTLTESQANAARAGVLAGVRRTSDAQALAESVLASDPKNTEAREVLGSLALQAGDHATAAKWFGEAVNLGSDDYLAYFYFAQLSLQHFGEPDPDSIEKSLRSAIRLNPQFAPSYDMLAHILSTQHKDLDEAHLLNVQAIQLDPSQLGYRMNAASILMEQGKYEDAASVLRQALKVSKAPAQQQMLEGRLAQIQRMVDARNGQEATGVITVQGAPDEPQPSGQMVVVTADRDNEKPQPSGPPTAVAHESAAGSQSMQSDIVVDVPRIPTHPAAAANALHHTLQGVIHAVKCGYPSVLELQLAGANKTVTLFNNNYFKIDLATLGFTPSASIDPCNNIEGMKARIEYAEAPDKEADGQVVSIILLK